MTPDDQSRLARIEERLSWLAQETARVRQDQAVCTQALSKLDVMTERLSAEVSTQLRLREDFDRLLETLSEEARDRRRAQAASAWQRAALAVGLLTWVLSSLVSIGIAAGWFG